MEKYLYIINRAFDISLITYAIPIIIAIFGWKFYNYPLKLAIINTIRTAIVAAIGLYFYYTNQSNKILYTVSPCFDIILVSLLFVAVFDLKKELKWILAIICTIFSVLMFYDYFASKNLTSTYLATFETAFVIILSIIMLRKVVLNYKSGTYKRSLTWILSALLVINIFAILSTSLTQTILAYSNKLLHLYWYLFSPLFIIITNLMVAYGFYIIRYKVKER